MNEKFEKRDNNVPKSEDQKSAVRSTVRDGCKIMGTRLLGRFRALPIYFAWFRSKGFRLSEKRLNSSTRLVNTEHRQLTILNLPFCRRQVGRFFLFISSGYNMGVVTVHGYPIPEGKSGQQAVDHLSKVLETLGATKVGTFCVECESYHSSGININRTLNVFHNTEHPASCFSLLDTGTCLVSDSNFDNLMLSMSGLYQSKKSNKMESKGPKYTLGDFSIKVGSVSIGPSFRGILIEVEYGPCMIPAACWDLLKEFMSSFMTMTPRDPHVYLQGKMNDVFSPIDIIHQYNDHFNNLRKMASVRDGLTVNQNTLSPFNQNQPRGPTPNQINPGQTPVSVSK